MKIPQAGDDVPRRWKSWFRADKEHSSEWRREAKEAFDFVAGRQWDEADRKVLEDELRPAITFNRTAVIIDAVSGNEIQDRQEIQFLPREQGDAMPNELFTEAARWFDDEADAPDEDSEAFLDSAICGMGWTESIITFDEEPEGQPEVNRMDPIEMYWDFSAKKSNLSDARRLWRVREFSEEEVEDRWPDIDKSDLDAKGWVDYTEDSIHSNNPEEYYNEKVEEDWDGEGTDRKTYQIIHIQWWQFEDYYKVADPTTNQIQDVEASKFERVSKVLKNQGIQLKAVKLRRRKYYQSFIGRKIIEVSDAPCPDRFNWNCITGKRDRGKGVWYGLVRQMKDPQTWANKWLSQLLHIMNSNAKGGVFYEEGAVVDQEDLEQRLAKPNAAIALTPGALLAGRIKERQPAQFPQGYQLLTEYAIQAIRDVVGINLEMLGMREANQPGVLEYQRKQAGLTVLAPMFNSLRRYRRNRGRVLLYYILEYLADGRLIRITGTESQKYVPLVAQADVRYDVIVDQSPSSPNQKELVWQSLVQILPGVKDIIPPPVLLQLLDYSPLPTSVVNKIKEVVTAPNPEQEQAKRLQAKAALLELAEKEAGIEKTKATTEKLGVDMINTRADARRTLAEEAVTSTEIKKTGAEIDLVEAQTEKALADAAKAWAEARNPRPDGERMH